jgi:hypothetical protein
MRPLLRSVQSALRASHVRESVIALTPLLSTRDRRILLVMVEGDLLWEAPGEQFATQYNPRTGRPGRIRLTTVKHLEKLGLIQRQSQDPAAHRLDSWQITETGRRLVAERAGRRVRQPPSSSLTTASESA